MSVQSLPKTMLRMFGQKIRPILLIWQYLRKIKVPSNVSLDVDENYSTSTMSPFSFNKSRHLLKLNSELFLKLIRLTLFLYNNQLHKSEIRMAKFWIPLHRVLRRSLRMNWSRKSLVSPQFWFQIIALLTIPSIRTWRGLRNFNQSAHSIEPKPSI